MTISITAFEEKDRPALQQLYLQVRKDTFTWLDADAFTLADFDEETAGESLLVARAGNAIIGFIAVWLPYHFIHHLYIDRAWQHKGIGARLLQAVTKRLSIPITLKCWQKNEVAIAFYKKNGFAEKEVCTTEEGAYIVFEYKGKSGG